MNEEKQKFIGGIDFDELIAQRVQVYNTLVIDLTTARSNEERTFVGNYLYVLEATDVDANLDIRFNQSFRGAIKLVKGRGVRAPFYRFYLTNAAQADKTITLAIGVESDSFEIFDVGKALEITGPVTTMPGFEKYEGAAGTGTDTLAEWIVWSEVVSRIDVFIWDNPANIYLTFSDDMNGNVFEVPVGFYSFDCQSKKLFGANKTAGNVTRYQIIGWY
ncbi:hypothetical protein ES702_06358 [subsurface metagenome]